VNGNADSEPSLARRLGAFDATMIVMGGIIGAGIFVNPSVVARQVHSPMLILLPWLIGGAIALLGAFVYAELAVLRPNVGGQYAYLRDAWHPLVAFLYGWTLLLVVQTGGMAGAAIIFGRYFHELSGLAIPEQAVAAITLGVLTAINCFGIRAGSNVQSALMLTKLGAIVMLIGFGWMVAAPADAGLTTSSLPASNNTWLGLAAAMVPVLFAYGGWQTASFVSGEMRDPRRDLPRGLFIGVAGVIIVYVLVTYVCLRALGPAGLAATRTPASEVMRQALGSRGAKLIACGIAISTVGFLSQSILTAPRVYYAMARDGVFFKAVGRLNERTRVPVIAIALQGLWAIVVALTGKYDQILNYVVTIDTLFFGLTGAALFVFRRREIAARLRRREEGGDNYVRVPWHPFTTGLFVLACWSVALSTLLQAPQNAGIGVGILALGALVYRFWAAPRRGKMSV
jgi:APA family basic amino acid/polyamine antiporter